MVSKFSGKPSDGKAVCDSVGLNYGLWTGRETANAALQFLRGRDSEELYIGLQKKREFTTEWSSCSEILDFSSIANLLEWIASPATNVPSIFTSSNSNFDTCSSRYIYVKPKGTQLKYKDGRYDRKFLCFKENGKTCCFLQSNCYLTMIETFIPRNQRIKYLEKPYIYS